jgi:hypothetical protein
LLLYDSNVSGDYMTSGDGCQAGEGAYLAEAFDEHQVIEAVIEFQIHHPLAIAQNGDVDCSSESSYPARPP